MPDAVTILAPAKLNLALAVGPPAADGYHPICSWMVTVDLYDELELKRLASDRLSRYAILWHEEARRPTPIDWSITHDLAVRAHQALEKHVGRRLPVQLKLDKRIPIGGGLGGGSSNAAAMLHALDDLFGLGLGAGALAEIGAGLGADVPFLVHGGSAIVEGLGERIHTHQEVPELHLVLAFPDASCPTGQVYGAFDRMGSGTVPGPRSGSGDGSGGAPDRRVRALADALPRRPDPEALFNDLTAAAIDVVPRLEEDLAALAGIAERPALVSGSGSSLFVLCDDPMHAGHLAREIEAASGMPAVAVTSVSRATVEPRCAPAPPSEADRDAGGGSR